jgi:hypothetical protein
MMIYEPNSRALHPFFVAYYSFASGMAGGIDFVGLIVRVVKRHPILLACHIAATSAMILADVIYAFSFGHFWQDGDFYLLYKIFAIVIYLRRYIFLKRLEDLTADEE